LLELYVFKTNTGWSKWNIYKVSIFSRSFCSSYPLIFDFLIFNGIWKGGDDDGKVKAASKLNTTLSLFSSVIAALVSEIIIVNEFKINFLHLPFLFTGIWINFPLTRHATNMHKKKLFSYETLLAPFSRLFSSLHRIDSVKYSY